MFTSTGSESPFMFASAPIPGLTTLDTNAGTLTGGINTAENYPAALAPDSIIEAVADPLSTLGTSTQAVSSTMDAAKTPVAGLAAATQRAATTISNAASTIDSGYGSRPNFSYGGGSYGSGGGWSHELTMMPMQPYGASQPYEEGGIPEIPYIKELTNTYGDTAGALDTLSDAADGATKSLYSMGQSSVPDYSQGYATGGDVVKASLTPGEFVMSPRATQKWYPTIKAMNKFDQPRFAEGGDVTNVGDVVVNINGSNANHVDGRQIAQAVRRTLRQKTARIT
jgi:hypothetical protein